MKEWLQSFNNPAFIPHGHCYQWRPDILWTHVLSDAAIGISYYMIPVMMAILIYRREQPLPYLDVFGLFLAFIFFCGTTHFVSIYVTWNPVYEYQGWLKAMTAFVSVLTVLVLIPKLPLLISLPGIEQSYRQSQSELDLLKQKYKDLKSVFAATIDREERIIELKKEVNKLVANNNQKPIYEV